MGTSSIVQQNNQPQDAGIKPGRQEAYQQFGTISSI